jgi:negative regulator of sigma-B (phosphoserine phosphatase)
VAGLSLQYGLARFVAPGLRACGDLAVVRRFDDGVVVAAIDGIGHGEEAATAARIAAEVIAGSPADSLATLVRRCDEALYQTRGVVLSIARLDLRRASLTWLGVGNVMALVHHPGVPPGRDELLLRAGVVGTASLPNLQPSDISLRRLDTLILATDGIRPQFADQVAFGGPPQSVADEILANYRHGGDDALVLVARLS